eukprot:CAMPEP_0173390770 /NCGR_PEP_ID=MMETSP1356-20130122/16113_1 /TAXON_ID=77927 ORGANISM="Hemiselmis virescens, Strain PCC157" /NCGR_SAMPLE_ID=MMETSP1356 /ASSEMBLY_ACC=CAM_ASM_000847 /LENGTH=110 /DNA_ID=CAMNT_0014348237 /DNA_START=17 /DNA_END=346 /DNA_ORIENTATION=+
MSASKGPQGEGTVDDVAVARALQEEYNRETDVLRAGRGWQDPTHSDYRTAGHELPSQAPSAPPPGAYCPVRCATCGVVNHVPYTTGIAVFRCTQCAFQNRVELTRRAWGE